MNRPIPGKSAANNARKSQSGQPPALDLTTEEYAERLKLAQHLHDQGIHPERWAEADPAPWPAQKHFQETGRKIDERHFDVAGRLYKSTPAVAASQAQGQDAIDVYLGAAPKPVEQLVDVAKVPLRHPFGRPHAPRSEGPDTHALNLHYAKFGVDPGKAHEGDPLPMPQQARLQEVTRAADGSEIPLGIPGIYRGYDDGFFYAANDGTQESAETQALRRKLATEKAQPLGDAAPIVANDNDPEIDEAVARSYQAGGTAQVSVSRLNRLLTSDYPTYLSTVTKLRKGDALTDEETKLCGAISDIIGQDNKEIADKNLSLVAARTDGTENEGMPPDSNGIARVDATAIPSVYEWLLNLLRGNGDDGSCPKPDCNEVFRHCQGLCMDMYATNPDDLPGEGTDMKGRIRRCIRECMEAHGCFDY